jgi:hypothetical protein
MGSRPKPYGWDDVALGPIYYSGMWALVRSLVGGDFLVVGHVGRVAETPLSRFATSRRRPPEHNNIQGGGL